MDEHKKFLADRLLSEEQPITYRVLSRALDVHVNTAKEMLYDFHSYQNTQKANSVHATYLIYGTKTPEKDESDGDVEMSGSSPEEPLSDEVPTSTLTLAREEELNDILAAYEQVVSIHVYSLSPHPQKDLSLLSDVASQLSEYSSNGDITAASKKYGVISNPNARRRERTIRPQASTSAPSQVVKKEPAASKSTSRTTAKQIKSVKQESSAPSSKEGTPAPSGGKKTAPSLKRGVSGGIMQSFAKAAAQPPKPKPASKKEDDTTMALSDDGEADDSDIVATKSKSTVNSTDIKRKRQEREDALRKMMEDEDEEEEEEKEDSDKESEQADEEMEEAPEPEPEPEAKKEESEPAEVISSTGDGRRRGRRRVMKKKRILDDQGYMVTIQEPGWESFSEDEAPPPAKKAAPAPTPTPSSSAGSKSKKPAPKGQGNIMSFFSKK
ncbi:hypothetical protein FGADI_6560 [Fusarium gaditjirri]|uniref:DNA polymerase delta subunit 3 n=1 Tax=Fusarium gaditjirri TaxID=282569 RepID=A0A8H4WWJ9_9HYPO|nr:hypothetical protein FGADI_6560 [Fusarium gaditjirri]